MKNEETFNAVVQKDGGWWIGWIPEISGVNCQGKTKAELVKNLRSALSEACELCQPS
jgi:predicted RNase H-like HicB family nuclease